MSTISVPLTAELEKFIDEQVKEQGSNKAAVVRRIIKKAREDAAVEAVLRAQKEPSLKGDLRELAMKFRD